ncbi:hypothetical protein SpCBS45565_g07367 [Spizellomyces sp. 'palustris']|nr:hypothetical protein SpCBS45565_g07367 [Spizellomyces sp. 'palustris']
MRIRGDSRVTEDAKAVLPSPVTESKSAFGRLGKKTSMAQMLGSVPSSPALQTPVLPPSSNLGTLEVLPSSILLKIVHVCSPELANVRNISHGYRELVERYIAKRTKRFQESIEEAECWGHRPPSLPDVVHLDPLTLDNILNVHYAARLVGPSGDSMAGDASERGPVSEMDADEEVQTEDGDFPRKGRPQTLRTIRRETMRRVIFAAFRETLDRYEEGCWAAVKVIRDFIVRHALHYTSGGPISDAGVAPPVIIPDDQSERDVSDGVSLRSVRMERVTTTSMPESVTPAVKDLNWVRLNSELFRLAAMHGHPFNLPPLCDVEDPQTTLTQGSDLSVRCHRPETLAACLDAARIYGCLWTTVEKGIQAAQASDRVGCRVPMDVILVLLDAAFNDPLGPWAYCLSMRTWGFEGWTRGAVNGVHAEDKAGAAARDLLVKAEECAKLYGIAWHRLSVKGEFAVVPVQEVAREVRSRVKIMM